MYVDSFWNVRLRLILKCIPKYNISTNIRIEKAQLQFSEIWGRSGWITITNFLNIFILPIFISKKSTNTVKKVSNFVSKWDFVPNVKQQLNVSKIPQCHIKGIIKHHSKNSIHTCLFRYLEYLSI